MPAISRKRSWISRLSIRHGRSPRIRGSGNWFACGWKRARCRPRTRKHLTADERRGLVAWIKEAQAFEAERNAGDPGPVLARRLSNAEYDYTIRDLTGVDIRPTREFPVDPANEAGFDNSGESLTMSPALLQEVPGGGAARRRPPRPQAATASPSPRTRSSPTPTATSTASSGSSTSTSGSRPIYADYFLAAWQYQHRERLGRPNDDLADNSPPRAGSAPSTWQTVWAVLTEPRRRSARSRTFATHGASCRQQQDAEAGTRAAASECATSSCDSADELASRSAASSRCKGISPGSQPFVLWRNRSSCADRRLPTSKLVDRRSPTRRDEARRDSRAGAILPRSSRCVLRRRSAARTSIPSAAGQGAAADRRLPPDAGLLPRRRAAVRADPRRRRAARARRAVAGARLRRAGPACGSTRTSSSSSGPSRRGSCAKRVRLRPRGGQGRDVGGEDEAAGRGVPRQGASRSAPSDDAIEAIETYFANIERRHPLGRAGAPGGRAEPPRRAARVRRAGLSPAADRPPSGRSCWRSTARCARRTSSATKRRCATRSSAC